MQSSPLTLGLALLTILAVTSGCGQSDRATHTGSIPSTDSLSIERQFVLNDSTGVYFGNVIDLAVDSDGRIYVCDNVIHTIWVFSPAGDSLRTIGAAGRGPGEFMRMGGIAMDRHDSLFAYDFREQRITAFGPTPEKKYGYTIPARRTKTGFIRRILKPDTTGFLIVYRRGPVAAERLNEEPIQWIRWIDSRGNTIRDSILVVPNRQQISEETDRGTMTTNLPFGRKPVFRIGPQNTLYYGWTDSLVIERHRLAGQLIDRIRLVSETHEVGEEDIRSYVARQDARWSGFGEDNKQLIQEADIPETYPAFEDFVLDSSGRLWIKHSGPTDGTARWTMVDPDRERAADFTLPREVSIEAVRGNRLYGIRALAGGIEEVVVYRFDL